MKKVKTTVREFDEKGNVIKESITEEEYENKQYPPLSPTNVPITYYPQYHVDPPNYKYELTCTTCDSKTIINNLSKSLTDAISKQMNRVGVL